MRIPQIWTLLIDSPKMFDIAPKINLLERSDWSRRSVTWLLFSSSQIIELIFCILNYFENLRFEQWIEQVRTNVRHAITVRGPLYVTICNLDGHVIRMGPSLVDRPSKQSETFLDWNGIFTTSPRCRATSSFFTDGLWPTFGPGCPGRSQI